MVPTIQGYEPLPSHSQFQRRSPRCGRDLASFGHRPPTEPFSKTQASDVTSYGQEKILLSSPADASRGNACVQMRTTKENKQTLRLPSLDSKQMKVGTQTTSRRWILNAEGETAHESPAAGKELQYTCPAIAGLSASRSAVSHRPGSTRTPTPLVNVLLWLLLTPGPGALAPAHLGPACAAPFLPPLCPRLLIAAHADVPSALPSVRLKNPSDLS